MKHRQIFIFIMALIVLASCDDDPVKPVTPPDPCAGKHPVSADFDMYESKGGFSRLKVSGDSVHYWDALVLKAKDTCEYYEWQLEGDTTKYNKKNISIRFEEPIGTIRVRLITKSKPNLSCFPNDDGADTVIKTITISHIAYSGIIGRFRGANLDTPNDTFEFQIKCIFYAGKSFSIQLNNFPRGYSDSSWHPYLSQWTLSAFYNAVRIENRGGLPLPKGWAIYDPKTNKIRVEYSLEDNKSNDPFARINYVFEGIRMGDE